MAPGARGAAARGSARGRGRRGRDRGRGRPQASVPPDAPADDAPADADICFICAEPVRMYSVPPCNHRVCHICSMRLRALWKKRECTFCKAEATRVIFTRHPTKGFGEFTADELPCSDEKLAIYFETEQDYHDTISLLRFHCPQPQCETLCSGWADLKAHAKREHTRLLCDLCVQHKKIFAHEHTLFTASSLQAHLSAEHKYCEYCRQHYYSDDELWVHMRDRHEQCHICKNRSEDERWRYYKDYRMLEQHFHEAHYLCPAKECLERKFVVFENQMEFQVHQLEEHGRALSARERKEALRVDPRFMYEGESSGRARGKKPARDTDTAGHARRAQFGRTLTSAADDEWDAVAALLHSPIKLTACQAALQAYRSGETTVDDLLRTVHTLTGESGQASGGPTHRVVQHLGDMLGAGEKADALQRAWAATQAQASFPSLAASTAPRTSARQAPARNAAHFPSLAAANSRAPASAPRAQGSSSWGAAAPPPRRSPRSRRSASRGPVRRTRWPLRAAQAAHARGSMRASFPACRRTRGTPSARPRSASCSAHAHAPTPSCRRRLRRGGARRARLHGTTMRSHRSARSLVRCRPSPSPSPCRPAALASSGGARLSCSRP